VAGGDGGAEIHLQAKGLQRQLVFCSNRLFASKNDACELLTAFVDWYNKRHRPRPFASSIPMSTRQHDGKSNVLKTTYPLLATTDRSVDQQANREPNPIRKATIN